jgi:alpha-beta hydrolase superfamily lysophospholipase
MSGTTDEAEVDPGEAPGRGRSRWRRWAAVAAAVALGVLAVSGVLRRCTEDAVDQHTLGTFEQLPDPLPAGAPGELIRHEVLLGAPNGAHAWRAVYHSTDVHGQDIGVSGTVVVPDRPAPEGGWPVVSWAHPTTGAVGDCAPSKGEDPFALMAGLHELLAAGYAVVATDYAGMGSDGPDSYLIGVTEGNNVLDMVRAARAIPDSGVGTELFLWGHSQGGQAALFAAQQAPSYAPELNLRAVAAAAPAADLAQLLADHRDDESGVTIGSYAINAFVDVYGPTDPSVRLDTVLTPEGAAVVPEIAPRCLLGDVDALHRIAEPVVGNFFAVDPGTTEPWSSILQENTPGGSPISVPVLIAQGDADELVLPPATAGFVAKLCGSGEHVTYRTYPGIVHGLIGERTVPYLLGWFSDVRAGRSTDDGCTPSGSGAG